MTSRRKLISALALAGVLVGGGVAGAMLGAPSLSSASTTGAASSQVVAHPHGAGQLDAAAQALGMTTDALRAELESGKTIAQVAGEKNVDVNTVIDAMVAAAETNLRHDITDMVNNGKPKGGPKGPGGPGFAGPGFGRGHGPGPGIDAAASALGLTPDALHAELESGKSIAQVAGEKGVDVQQVIDAIVAAESARIDQAVTDGHLTQAQADTKKADLAQRVADQVNRVGEPHPPK